MIMEDNEFEAIILKFEDAVESRTSIYLDAEDWADLVGYYIDAFDDEYAEKALLMGKEQYPMAFDLLVKELELYLFQENLEKASRMIRELKQLNVHDLDFALAEAKYWSLRGFSERAIMLYEKALEFNEDESFVHNCIGDEYMITQDFAMALMHFKKALEFDANDSYAFMSALDCYTLLHKDNESVKFIERHLDINPYNELAWYALGELKMKQEKFMEAAYAFDYAIVIQPDYTPAYLQKAACYEQLERFSEAIETYSDVLDYHKNDEFKAYIYNQMAKNFIKLHDFTQAKKFLFHAIQLDSASSEPYYQLAKIYVELNFFEKANFFMKEALNLDSENEDYLKEMIYILISLGHLEEALELQKKLAESNPTTLHFWKSYLLLMVTLGETSDALHIISDLEKNTSHPDLFYLKAACLAHQNFMKEAMEYLFKATSIAPESFDEYLELLPILGKLSLHKNN